MVWFTVEPCVLQVLITAISHLIVSSSCLNLWLPSQLPHNVSSSPPLVPSAFHKKKKMKVYKSSVTGLNLFLDVPCGERFGSVTQHASRCQYCKWGSPVDGVAYNIARPTEDLQLLSSLLSEYACALIHNWLDLSLYDFCDLASCLSLDCIYTHTELLFFFLSIVFFFYGAGRVPLLFTVDTGELEENKYVCFALFK